MASEDDCEVERWCTVAASGADERSTVGALSMDMIVLARKWGQEEGGWEVVQAFLALFAELGCAKRRAPRQHRILSGACSRAVAESPVMRTLCLQCWRSAVEASSGDVHSCLRAILQAHLHASSNDATRFWTTHYTLLVRDLSEVVASQPSHAHVRKHVVEALLVLHNDLLVALGEPIPSHMAEPLLKIAHTLALQDPSPSVREPALNAILSLKGDGGRLPRSILDLLLMKATDKHPGVRATSLSALCGHLTPADAPPATLVLLMHRGCFDASLPESCKSACRDFVVEALTSADAALSPTALLLHMGVADMLMGRNGWGAQAALAKFEELIDHEAAIKLLDRLERRPEGPGAGTSGCGEDQQRNAQSSRQAERPLMLAEDIDLASTSDTSE